MSNVLSLLKKCPTCQGHGRARMEVEGHTLYGSRCRFCRGSGKVTPKKLADLERSIDRVGRLLHKGDPPTVGAASPRPHLGGTEFTSVWLDDWGQT